MDNPRETLPLASITRTNVLQSVVARLNEFIDKGDLAPGDRLPSERKLAEWLNVSRTSVRQALKTLEALGRVETRVGSGTYRTGDEGYL